MDPVVMDELHALRHHKLDLEDKLNGLQDSRRFLMGELAGLMKLLKVKGIYIHTSNCSNETRSQQCLDFIILGTTIKSRWNSGIV